MHIVLAFDSFKGSLSSAEVAHAAQAGIMAVYPHARCNLVTLADGGEGTVDALIQAHGASMVHVSVQGPFVNTGVTASYAISTDGGTAIMEMAQVAGLPLVEKHMRNPRLANTYGLGQLILDALERGVRQFIVGIGGSASNDGGMGMLSALGYRFLSASGGELLGIGEHMHLVHSIDDSAVHPLVKEARFRVMCDVDNPFYGSHGSAEVFARQKGAGEADVMFLDAGAKIFASVIKQYNGLDVQCHAGSGAAGGLGAAFLLLGTQLQRGIDVILDAVNIDELLYDADIVLTGEGALDGQSMAGKAPIGVALRAQKKGIPCIAVCGSLLDGYSKAYDYGISACFSILSSVCSLDEAISSTIAQKNVEESVKNIFLLLQKCSPSLFARNI